MQEDARGNINKGTWSTSWPITDTSGLSSIRDILALAQLANSSPQDRRSVPQPLQPLWQSKWHQSRSAANIVMLRASLMPISATKVLLNTEQVSHAGLEKCKSHMCVALSTVHGLCQKSQAEVSFSVAKSHRYWGVCASYHHLVWPQIHGHHADA